MPILKNIRWERFCHAIAKGKTQDAAFALAGYKPDRAHAARLAANGRVRERIAELIERFTLKTEVTVATLTQQLIEDREFARSLDSPSAAAQASGLLMKLHGLGSEKLKVETQSVVDYLADMSRADIPVEAINYGESVH